MGEVAAVGGSAPAVPGSEGSTSAVATGHDAVFEYSGSRLESRIVLATAGVPGLEISGMLAKLGVVTLDPGYANTGATTSAVTYIDGDHGILRYRGYPIERLAESSNFVAASC